MAKRNDDFEFEIIEHIGTITDNATSWPVELNIVSFNDGEANYDIRKWNKNHTRMSKGIALTFDELKKLSFIIDNYIKENSL